MTEQAQSITAQQIRTALAAGLGRLNGAGVPSASLAAELLLMHVIERDRTWLYAHPEQELSTEQAATYTGLLEARAAGTPVQYLTGRQEFWGLDFEVTPAVLIPRPETEHLIEVTLERLGARRGERLVVADVGTGSGCIAVALARELPQARFVATDISAEALEVARRNAARHGVSHRVDFLEADLLNVLNVRATNAGKDLRFPAETMAGEPKLQATPSAGFSLPKVISLAAVLIRPASDT